MLYTVEIFKNTGFTSTNIPDSVNLLRSLFAPLTLPSVWVLQDRYRSSIKVNVEYESIKNADYCCINDVYYFVNNIQMVNENVCVLGLETDFITTIGIQQLNIVSGWCVRRHVNSDTLFDNEIPENFVPTNELEMDMGIKIGDTSAGSYKNIICCTVKLTADFSADLYTYKDGGQYVTVPKIPPVDIESEMYMTTQTGSTDSGRHFQMPQCGLYDADNVDIKEKVQSLRSLGIESSIRSTYKIPNNYIESTFESDGWIIQVKSKYSEVQVDSLPYEYLSSIKNKKAFSGQFQQYKLYSVTSGDMNIYQPETIYNNDTAPKFMLFADPQPTGKPYCRPRTYRGNTTDVFIEAVAGSEWQNYQLAFYSQSGQALADLQYSQAKVNTAMSTIGSVVNAAGNIASLEIGQATAEITGDVYGRKANLQSQQNTIYNTGTGILSNITSAVQNSQNYNIAKNIVSPSINFPLANNLQNYYSNCFWVCRTRLSNADTIRFDNYLTQFGYAVNEPLTDAVFSGRKNFNYVQAIDVNINANTSLLYRMGAIQQLARGIRVWHVAPNISAMYDNPIVGGT